MGVLYSIPPSRPNRIVASPEPIAFECDQVPKLAHSFGPVWGLLQDPNLMNMEIFD